MPKISRRTLTSRRQQLIALSATKALNIAWTTDTHINHVVGEDPNAVDATQGPKMFWMAPQKLRVFAQQVNASSAHFVLHTGDCGDDGNDGSYFREFWGLVIKPKAEVAGNHDYAQISYKGALTYEAATAINMGRENSPTVAGSRMNYTVVMTGNGISALLIIIDSNVGLDESPIRVGGVLNAAQKLWIADQLNNSPYDLIFLASHHGPHNYNIAGTSGTFFNPTDAADLQTIIEADALAHPSHKVRYLFGHNHIQHVIRFYNNLGSKLPGNLAPAMLESNPSAYAILHIFANGEIATETRYVNGIA